MGLPSLNALAVFPDLDASMPAVRVPGRCLARVLHVVVTRQPLLGLAPDAAPHLDHGARGGRGGHFAPASASNTLSCFSVASRSVHSESCPVCCAIVRW